MSDLRPSLIPVGTQSAGSASSSSQPSSSTSSSEKASKKDAAERRRQLLQEYIEKKKKGTSATDPAGSSSQQIKGKAPVPSMPRVQTRSASSISKDNAITSETAKPSSSDQPTEIGTTSLSQPGSLPPPEPVRVTRATVAAGKASLASVSTLTTTTTTLTTTTSAPSTATDSKPSLPPQSANIKKTAAISQASSSRSYVPLHLRGTKASTLKAQVREEPDKKKTSSGPKKDSAPQSSKISSSEVPTTVNASIPAPATSGKGIKTVVTTTTTIQTSAMVSPRDRCCQTSPFVAPPPPPSENSLPTAAAVSNIPAEVPVADPPKERVEVDTSGTKKGVNIQNQQDLASKKMQALALATQNIKKSAKAIKEILKSPFKYVKHPLILRVVDKDGKVLSQERVPLPQFDLFTVKDASAIAKAGYPEAARMCFQVIESCANMPRALHMGPHPTKSAAFWLAWTSLEESMGNADEVVKIFERAQSYKAEPHQELLLGLQWFIIRRMNQQQHSTEQTNKTGPEPAVRGQRMRSNSDPPTPTFVHREIETDCVTVGTPRDVLVPMSTMGNKSSARISPGSLRRRSSIASILRTPSRRSIISAPNYEPGSQTSTSNLDSSCDFEPDSPLLEPTTPIAPPLASDETPVVEGMRTFGSARRQRRATEMVGRDALQELSKRMSTLKLNDGSTPMRTLEDVTGKMESKIRRKPKVGGVELFPLAKAATHHQNEEESRAWNAVLTPARASKRERDLFGVSTIVTPLRRSERIRKSLGTSIMPIDQVTHLIATGEAAYVPNRLLPKVIPKINENDSADETTERDDDDEETMEAERDSADFLVPVSSPTTAQPHTPSNALKEVNTPGNHSRTKNAGRTPARTKKTAEMALIQSIESLRLVDDDSNSQAKKVNSEATSSSARPRAAKKNVRFVGNEENVRE